MTDALWNIYNTLLMDEPSLSVTYYGDRLICRPMTNDSGYLEIAYDDDTDIFIWTIYMLDHGHTTDFVTAIWHGSLMEDMDKVICRICVAMDEIDWNL